MKWVTLQFPDLYLLWSFAQTLRSNNLEINTGSKTLVCNCTEENISEATFQVHCHRNQYRKLTGAYPFLLKYNIHFFFIYP
jgi:hypothetical protein